MPTLRERARNLLQRTSRTTPIRELQRTLRNVRDALRGLEHPRELRHPEVREALRSELHVARRAIQALPQHVRTNLDPHWLELRDVASTLRGHARNRDLHACARVLREDLPATVWAPHREDDHRRP